MHLSSFSSHLYVGTSTGHVRILALPSLQQTKVINPSSSLINVPPGSNPITYIDSMITSPEVAEKGGLGIKSSGAQDAIQTREVPKLATTVTRGEQAGKTKYEHMYRPTRDASTVGFYSLNSQSSTHQILDEQHPGCSFTTATRLTAASAKEQYCVIAIISTSRKWSECVEHAIGTLCGSDKIAKRERGA